MTPAVRVCPACGKTVRVTTVNELRVHTKPKSAGGGRCPLSRKWLLSSEFLDANQKLIGGGR